MKEERVKTAVIGAGRWGTNVARELSAVSELVAIVTRTPPTEERSADAPRWMSLQEVCDSPDITAAWVATPIPSHAEVAQMLIAAGKHVLLEKPASGLTSEAKRLSTEAATHNLVFAVGYVFLYDPAYQELKRRLDKASVSRARFVWKKYGTFIEPIELNLLTHHLSIALDLFGNPQNGTLRTAENGNMADALLTYGHFELSSHIDRESEEKSHVIEIELADGALYRWDMQCLSLRRSATEEFEVVYTPDKTSLATEAQAFIDAVSKGNIEGLVARGDFGVRVLALYDTLELPA